MTARQFRYIKLCSSDHLLRAENVSRVVAAKSLLDLTQTDADHVIKFLERCYYEPVESLPGVDFDTELGRCLAGGAGRGEQVSDGLRLLALLATNRVATLGQFARYVFGVDPRTRDVIRGMVAPLLDELMCYGFVGCVRGVGVSILGDDVKTDIYYLTEQGSEALHSHAPHVNYHARPGLPPRSRVQHELAVTEARLCIQTTHHVENYQPESMIRGEQERARRKHLREGHGSAGQGIGCGSGDFAAWLVDAETGEGIWVEVEVTIRARQREIAAKPVRVKVWFAGTQHRCDLIEWSRGEFARLLPDFREPLNDAEREQGRGRAISKWRTVGAGRLDKVRNALDRLGGVGTPEAVAVVTGLKVSTASEALACLADKGEVERRDGFHASGKRAGRNLRLYLRRGLRIHSTFEFSRLLDASRAVSARALEEEFGCPLWPLDFDTETGVMILGGKAMPGGLVIAVVDDATDSPDRVATWARTAHRQATDGTLRGLRNVYLVEGAEAAYWDARGTGFDVSQDQVAVITSDEGRAEALRAAGRFKAIIVGA